MAEKDETMRDDARNDEKEALVLNVLFCLGIAIPCLGTVFGWDLYPPQDENRVLAKWSDLQGVGVGDVPETFGSCFKDNFAFRNLLIRRYRKLRHNIVGTRSDRVVEGKDRWLFLNRQGSILDYRGASQVTEAELQGWIRNFQARTELLKKRGVHYMFVIPPNKTQVYPEKLPDDLRKLKGTSRVEHLMAELKEHPDLDVTYLKDDLIAAKEDHVLFLANDTHWNDRGSFVAHQAIVKRLQKRFPDIQPAEESDFKIHELMWYGDLGRMTGLPEKFVAPRERLIPNTGAPIMLRPLDGSPEHPKPPPALHTSEHPEIPPAVMRVNPRGRGRAIVFHDSFCTFGMREILPEVFAEVTFIANYSTDASLKEYVDALKPDVVIEIMVERRMGHVGEFDPVTNFYNAFAKEN